MRLLVYHNPGAGHDDVPQDTLMGELQRAGHDVFWLEKGGGSLREALARPLDAVVVAGGDGSVAAVGRKLAGQPTAIVVLPAGTANNIATLLGTRHDNLLQVLASGRTMPFDVGVVEGNGINTRFLEAVGFGPFADAVAILSRREDGPPVVFDRQDELDRDLHVLRESTLRDKPCECRLELDGQELTGRLLMVEVMNTSMIGPNLRLAPEAVPSDGLLDVVIVDVAERDELLAYLNARKENPLAQPSLMVRRAGQVRVRVPGGRWLHIDGEAVEHRQPLDLEIRVDRAALRFLVPPAG